MWEAPRLAEAPTSQPLPKRTPATAPAWDAPGLLATMDQPKQHLQIRRAIPRRPPQ
ncbi:hypothetical protein ACFY0A_27740 [Streptomyces sp. NPDC001698]|uniref:hypothetical protein n=1 Tax=unclassified Streptomyces TaxID=2593676 RepID=UPI001CD412BE|nr:hypothetical protein [Streptomyces sp. CoT10]